MNLTRGLLGALKGGAEGFTEGKQNEAETGMTNNLLLAKQLQAENLARFQAQLEEDYTIRAEGRKPIGFDKQGKPVYKGDNQDTVYGDQPSSAVKSSKYTGSYTDAQGNEYVYDPENPEKRIFMGAGVYSLGGVKYNEGKSDGLTANQKLIEKRNFMNSYDDAMTSDEYGTGDQLADAIIDDVAEDIARSSVDESGLPTKSGGQVYKTAKQKAVMLAEQAREAATEKYGAQIDEEISKRTGMFSSDKNDLGMSRDEYKKAKIDQYAQQMIMKNRGGRGIIGGGESDSPELDTQEVTAEVEAKQEPTKVPWAQWAPKQEKTEQKATPKEPDRKQQEEPARKDMSDPNDPAAYIKKGVDKLKSMMGKDAKNSQDMELRFSLNQLADRIKIKGYTVSQADKELLEKAYKFYGYKPIF